MKERLSVYLDPPVMRSLIDYADRRGKSKSLIAEAAIASFLSPDAAERQEATLARRLDRLVRQTERLERDVRIAVETLALFVRFWLTATPALPEQTRPPRAPKAPNGTMPSSRLSVGGSPKVLRCRVKCPWI